MADPFRLHEGIAVSLLQDNIDTDQIIPSREMKTVSRHGLADGLFAGWRYLDADTRRENPDFVLNQPAAQQASILLSGENFGCGSSREHAVWSILEYGFRAVIAPSFADIFYSNCFKNGLLPIVLSESDVDTLFALAPEQAKIDINLAAQQVSVGEHVFNFDIDPGLKEKMLGGMDDIALSLAEREQIGAFEAQHKQAQPWLFQKREL